MSEELTPYPGEIGDEQVAAAAPRVRGLVVRRLEQIWATCAPHLDPEGAMGKPDPRFVEAGIRVLDRITKLYRLDVPVVAPETSATVADAAVTVEQGLAELEARRQQPD